MFKLLPSCIHVPNRNRRFGGTWRFLTRADSNVGEHSCLLHSKATFERTRVESILCDRVRYVVVDEKKGTDLVQSLHLHPGYPR